jgi:hypothetical protein
LAENKEMREPNQRFWDAMIIKSWQNFDNCLKLNIWAMEEFGKYPQDLELKRTQNCFSGRGQGVRVWVADYMPALSERLFALPKERHIELLDWLAKSKVDSLTSKGSKSRKYYHEARSAMKAAERKATQKTWSDNLEKTLNQNNRWTTVK